MPYEYIATSMSTFIDSIYSNLGLIGAIAGVISVPLAIFFGVKSRQKQLMLYTIERQMLISNNKSSYQGVKFFHYEKEIENLFLAKIYIWNAGNKVINQSDIAPKEPVTIQVHENLEILDCRIQSMSNDANNASVSKSNDKFNLVFDFFAKNDGVILQILYTGNINDMHKMRIDGVVKEQGKIKYVSTIDINNNRSENAFIHFITSLATRKFLIFGTGLAIGGLISTFFFTTESQVADILFRTFFGVAAAILTILILIEKTIPKKLHKVQVPDVELDADDETTTQGE